MLTRAAGRAGDSAQVEAIVVGASAGAVEALNALLPAFPSTLEAAVIVVVHLPQNRPAVLVELFAAKCALAVREAEDKCAIGAGTIWFAPPGYHLLVEEDRSFSLSLDEPVHFSRPSIDVLFESAAEVYRDKLLALVLTGANQDGALGARAVQRAGGLLGVQDPATAPAEAMPQACLAATAPDFVGTVAELARFACAHALGGQP